MVLRMANPTKNKYGVYLYAVRVPADLVHLVGKERYSISLRTKDPKEARKRFNEMVSKKEREHAALRAPQESIPFERIVFLAGEAYRSLSAVIRESPGPLVLEMNAEGLSARAEDPSWLRSLADDLLTSEGLSPDDHSRALLVGELQKAFGQLSSVVSRMSGGDFSPDENLKRFPLISKATPKPVAGRVSITDLYDLWKRDHLANNKAPRTAAEYETKVAYFIKWLKHDDATAVTKRDLACFADHLRHDKDMSAKTVDGKYLTCIRAIFRKGFQRDLLEVNVAAAVSYEVPKRIVTRSPGYTDAEAKAVLAVANRSLLPPEDGRPERRSLHNRLAGRWVPWLQCYTGARVAEMTQLRKEDVFTEHGVPCLRITPEAGSVKTGLASEKWRGFLELKGNRNAEAEEFYQRI